MASPSHQEWGQYTVSWSWPDLLWSQLQRLGMHAAVPLTCLWWNGIVLCRWLSVCYYCTPHNRKMHTLWWEYIHWTTVLFCARWLDHSGAVKWLCTQAHCTWQYEPVAECSRTACGWYPPSIFSVSQPFGAVYLILQAICCTASSVISRARAVHLWMCPEC
jgi:hypothetical protein